jgi:hypothetical protein
MLIYLISQVEIEHTDCGTHPASYSTGSGVVCQRLTGRGVKLISQPHLVSRLRMSGAIPLFLSYAFMAWKNKVSSNF